MSQALISQLQSSDPEQRKQAIIALGKAKERQALKALAYLYKNDPVPEIRDLAYKAGRYITQQTQDAASPPARSPAPEPSPSSSLYDPYSSSNTDSGYYVDQDAADAGWQDPSRLPKNMSYGTGLSGQTRVSQGNIDRAISYYNRALDLLMKGDRVKAAAELARALEINPNLAQDIPSRNLAAEILEVDPQEAMDIIQDPVRRALYVGEGDGGGTSSEGRWASRRPKDGTGKPRKEVTWSDVNIDLAIMFVVTIVVMLVSLLLGNAANPRAALPIGQMVIPVLTFGGVSTLSTLLSLGAVHFMVKFFIGEATMRETYHTLIPIQTGIAAVSFVALLLPTMSPSLACAGPLIVLAVSFGGSFWMGQRLANVHNIELWQGCAALIIGPIILGILVGVAFSLLLSAFLGPMMAIGM